MAIVPRPNRVGVSQASQGPKTNAQALGAGVGVAAANLLSAGADAAAVHFAQKEKNKQELDAAKEKVADGLYAKKLDITSYELKSGQKAVVETMNDSYAHAEPEEFEGILETTLRKYTENFDQLTKDLKPEDVAILQDKKDIDEQAMRAHTNLLHIRKVEDRQTAVAEREIKNAIGDGTMESQVEVDKWEKVLIENVGPTEAANRMDKLQSAATFEGFRDNFDNAQSLEDVQQLLEALDDAKGDMQVGHQGAIKNKSIQAFNRINTEKLEIAKGYEKIAYTDEDLPVTEMEVLVDEGKLDRSEADRIYELASDQKLKRTSKSNVDAYKRTSWSVDRKRLENFVGDIDTNNWSLTNENMQAAEKFIDKRHKDPAVRSYIKVQWNAMVRDATQEVDHLKREPVSVLENVGNKLWFGTPFGISDDMGAAFDTLPDNLQEGARAQYGDMLGQISTVMDTTGADLPLSDLYTTMQSRLIAGHLVAQRAGTVFGPEQAEKLAKDSIDLVMDKVVQDHLDTPTQQADIPEITQSALDSGITPAQWAAGSPEDRALFE